MKYVVIITDGYEFEYDIFDTEEQIIEFINSPSYKKYSTTVFKGEELAVIRSSGGNKILYKPQEEIKKDKLAIAIEDIQCLVDNYKDNENLINYLKITLSKIKE